MTLDKQGTTNPRSFIARAEAHRDAVAIIDQQGRHTYGELLDTSARIAAGLLAGRSDLDEARIAFLLQPGFDYVATQWAIWQAGGIAVPLAIMHPLPELEYVVADTGAEALIGDSGAEDKLAELARAHSLPLQSSRELACSRPASLPAVTANRRAMILYTSGTTSRPKGVVSTHANIESQVSVLVSAWEWSRTDHILNVLPLHHVHGIINVVSCALWAGACCEFSCPFDAGAVWRRMEQGGLTLFMAVPTIYNKLIQAWEQAEPPQQQAYTEAAAKLRLMVSGSAALPVPTLERWQQIAQQTLLERYGMTEIGMALSNPLHGERRAGHVGGPLPNIEVRRVDETGTEVGDETPGEIEVRGPTVFSEYWRRGQATAEAFRDGWFRTGDVAIVERGAYRILGRDNIDIIKTGGYKVSALEIEEVLLAHAEIQECAVVGIADDEWGEVVAACVVASQQSPPTLDTLREWARARLAPYKLPRRLLVVDSLPRNAMGKVQKPAVIDRFALGGQPQ